ncbi:MAG: hypothetical protein PHT77_11160 [Bacteroidales bacterium]|nr:hypothetical protein [Bacteroidales bacterium]MDD3962405.1 hypothetical protein [Bacteroidales bacterium]
MKSRNHKTLIGILALLALLSVSCKTPQGFTSQKQYERTRKKETRLAVKEIKKLKKAHFKRQTPQTREMMKQTQKKARELNRFRRK